MFITTSKPDIAYSVGVCAWYQSKPKESHITVVKRMMKYVCVIAEYGLWLSLEINTISLVIKTQTGHVVWMIGKAHLEGASLLATTWLPGIAKDKLRPPCRPLRRNILLQGAVVHNFYG